MSQLRLVIPTIEHEQQCQKMMNEWEAAGGRLNPGALRKSNLDYAKWLSYLSADSKEETCQPGHVPQSFYFLMNENNQLLGAVSIRHYLNEDLLNTGGHIGYGIRPSARGQGYGKEQLRLALEKCRAMGINRVLVTCDKDNPASASVIMANGGVLETEVIEEDHIVQRYWIELA